MEITNLTAFDQCIRTHFSLLMCFALPEDRLPISNPLSSASQSIAYLQRGLDSASLSNPFLKGRIRLCKIDGAYTGGIEAVLDAGAQSPQVLVKDLTLAIPCFEELSNRGFPLKYFDPELLLPQPAHNVDDGHVFKLQANIISGGLILCATAHHSFMDAQGLAVVIQQFGTHLVAGQAAPKLSAESIDRSRLFLEYPPNQPIKWASDVIRSEMPPQSELSRHPGVTGRMFRCSESAMKELKDKVWGLLTNSNDWVSTADALSAFVWICVTLARHNGTHDSQKHLYIYPNVRAKFKTPLPKSYVGNCVLSCGVHRQVSQLFACLADKAMFETIIASVAIDVRRALIRLDADRMREHVEAMYQYSNHRYNLGGGEFPLDHMGISSLYDLAIYSVDFGGILGKTAAVRLPDNQTNGMALVLPKSPEDSLEYCLWLEDESMQRLMKNPFWNELFTPVD